MRKILVFIIAAFFAFPGFFSCQSFSSALQEPRLSLKSVELAGISFNRVDMIAHVDVENLNNFDLPFPKIDWQLFINSASFVQGELDKGVNLKRRRTTTVPVHFSFTYEGLYRSISSLIELKEAAYNIALGITFPLPVIQDKTFHLEWSGNFPLIEVPKISPGTIRIAKIDFQGVELACGLNIENFNSFPIPFPNMQWEYAAAGIPLITNVVGQNEGELPPNAVSPVDVMVSVNYADLIRAVPSLANAGEASSLLTLNSGFSFPAHDEIKSMLEIPGTLPILRMPEFSIRGINIKDLGLLRFEFVVNMEIENRNAFSMNVERFNYDFKVNNAPWASGLFENPPLVRANARTAMPLTVVIESLSMVRDLQDIISKGSSVNYSCLGNMILTSDFPGMPRLDKPVNVTGSTRLLR